MDKLMPKVEQLTNLHNLQPKSVNSKLNLSVSWTLSSLSQNPKAKKKNSGKKKRPNRKVPRKNKIAKDLTAAGHQVARSCHQARPARAKLLAGWSCLVLWRTAVRS